MNLLAALALAFAPNSFAQTAVAPIAQAPAPLAGLASAALPSVTPGVVVQPALSSPISIAPSPALPRFAGEGDMKVDAETRSLWAGVMQKAASIATALTGNSAAADPERAVGKLKWIPVLALRPMQFEVGMREVAEKAAKFRAMSPAEQRKYLSEHPIPVIERSNGSQHVNKGALARKEVRPDDHHHLARAAWEAGIEKIAIRVQKEENGKNGKRFWKKMAKKNLVYLYDQFGNGPHTPDDLPMDVRGLADDPYRSMAGKVRDLGGYDKTHEPFAEFRWANFFRENIATHPNRDWDAAVKEALKLAHSKKAKKLPGYKNH